ncbi:unnamed protein product [Rotaria sordida]|uniref:Uncharacterized protein n=1 Tax=Rotaria sordida TaxID=392033 RepID=A0A813ZS98_9BILA|nr:unnamed protein product [Rotaria sordida]CAF0940719.1 unnamed protein product [Rotaria sordida]
MKIKSLPLLNIYLLIYIGICSVVILNNSKKIFIEHKADDYLPEVFTMENVRLFLQNMVEHIRLNSSEDKITSVIILGGLEDKKRQFELLQGCISKLSQDDYDDDDDELQNYNDLLKNIKWLNTTFNIDADNPQETGEYSINIIIDKLEYINEQRFILIQRVKKINSWNVINAVMVFNLQGGHAQFAVASIVTGTHKK